MLIGFIEWILELVLNFRMAERNLKTAMSARNSPQLMMNAYNCGQYQDALAFCNASMQCGMDLGVFQGDLLMQLGRFADAEQVLAQALTRETEPKSTALAHCCLGELFLVQQRYEQAMRCFTTAQSLWPERGATFRSIAEVWLRRGDNPAEALRCANLAVQTEKAHQGVAPMTKVMNLGAELATLAWAVAATSRNAEQVDRWVAEADSYGAGIPVTSIAQMHVYSGMAYTALGDDAKRAQHFEAAARMDPNGVWGREAQGQCVGV